jgi:hypothetical protein
MGRLRVISKARDECSRARAADGSAVRNEDIEKAIQATTDIYRRNVFPEMHVTLERFRERCSAGPFRPRGRDPEMHVTLVHVSESDRSHGFSGLFRYRDDDHKTKEGKSIGQDCETCHRIE